MKVYLVLEINFGTEGDYGFSTGLIWASLDKKKALEFIGEKKSNLNEDGTKKDDLPDEEDCYYPSRYDYQLLEYELEKEDYQYIAGEIE
uniref:hypothetical protein n=1 Tax=Anaerococcus mediterraneensis TaxID=1870984 RepID=UPI0009305621|nr:hypothetical protein [Anaerococcus mediterraneensis]